jgi:7-cyano-7-deazaguanine synthase
MSKIIVLTSGGLDSGVCLTTAVRLVEAKNVVALSFEYGQKHRNELIFAEQLTTHFACKHIIKRLDPSIFQNKTSALTGPATMPQMTYEELSKSQGVSPTYVPFRNGNLLSIAASIALNEEADEIFAGMHSEDARGWAYPDCTPEFIGAMACAIYVGTYHKVRLIAPLMILQKWQIVKWGSEIGTPFEKTWSCYEGGELHCGTCPTCVSRKEAFTRAEINDPTRYVR